MGLIVAPFPKETEERIARDMNRLFNLFLPEVKRTIGAKNPEYICLEDFRAACLFYYLQGELLRLRGSMVVDQKILRLIFGKPKKSPSG